MRRRGFVGLALIAVLAAAIVIVLTLGDDDEAPTDGAAGTATPQPELAVGEVVQRFVDALQSRDTDALYALQEEAYKRVCDRSAFQSFADRLQAQPLEGPAQIVVEGDQANAALYEVQADGSRERVVIRLIQEADGGWRLAAPSTSGCAP
jgi:hypothetical protein